MVNSQTEEDCLGLKRKTWPRFPERINQVQTDYTVLGLDKNLTKICTCKDAFAHKR